MRQFHLHPPQPVRRVPDHGLRAAAVLIPLLEGKHGLEVVLNQRPLHLRNHAGQICFPGGRREPGDADLRATALREYREEMGAASDDIEIVGQLPDFPVISRFIIRPFVGFLPGQPIWQPDPGEVDAVFTVPLSHLLNQQLHYAYRIQRFNYDQIWFIPWQHRLIWGATAGIIRALADQLRPQQRQLYRPLN